MWFQRSCGRNLGKVPLCRSSRPLWMAISSLEDFALPKADLMRTPVWLRKWSVDMSIGGLPYRLTGAPCGRFTLVRALSFKPGGESNEALLSFIKYAFRLLINNRGARLAGLRPA